MTMGNRETADLERELSGCADLQQYLDRNTTRSDDQRVARSLAELMEQRGISRSALITGCGLNDIYVHQILSGYRRPSRDKLLCLALGLGLSAEQVQQLLKSCGYASLYARDHRDSIILFGFYHGKNINEINDQLYEQQEPILT